MEEITLHSIERASEEAVKLWSLSSAQYPFQNRFIQEYANATIIEVISSFALNARRAMEVLPPKVKYPLNAARWEWEPTIKGEKVADLWDALNRIIHAQKLYVGFEPLPDSVSVIDGGAIGETKVSKQRCQTYTIDEIEISIAISKRNTSDRDSAANREISVFASRNSPLLQNFSPVQGEGFRLAKNSREAGADAPKSKAPWRSPRGLAPS